MSWIVFFSKWLSPDFKKLAATSKRIQLVTISISHYCEIASWSLKLANIPFVEHDYAPLQHVLPALRVRVGSGGKHLSSSSRTTPAAPNMSAEEAVVWEAKQAKADRAARSAAVPVAVCPDGSVWLDSWEVAQKSGLHPIDPALRILLDEQVGPLARQMAYCYILQPHNGPAFDALCTQDRHWLWALLWRLLLRTQVREKLAQTMRVHDPQARALCRERLLAAVGQLDALLAARTGPYLAGDAPGVGDIALASLVAPLVNPPRYCVGRYESVFAQLMRGADMQGEVDFWRDTGAGRHTMHMYEKH
ncbi:hypothetical protein B484DRAFT_452449, partial [Ochromonadaceae sp. CCMP2298]